MNFADRLQVSIDKSSSFIVAGIDPVIKNLPTFITDASGRPTNEESLYQALVSFHVLAIEALQGTVAAVKPNFGFFVQYGIGGIRAFQEICRMAREAGIPVVADAKVGDIGNTARAYSSGFLGKGDFDVDALTVNPFLGFDTLEPFLEDCRNLGKGLFVLVKTSNPGSGDIQNVELRENISISGRIADWIARAGKDLTGACGYSSIGAVVGATYPEEARELRRRMPDNIFLIPGMGAQGGSASDAVQGFSAKRGGAIINLSRALLGSFGSEISAAEELKAEIRRRAIQFNAQVADALKQV